MKDWPIDRKVLSWCLFDFANSSYSAVIAAVISPVYYSGVIVGNAYGAGDLWWGRAISASMAFVAVSSPLLGGLADYAGIRKRLLFLYTLICVVAVASLSIVHKGMALEGFILIVMANIGMEGGLVFYNSFLPEIAETTRQGRVSAWERFVKIWADREQRKFLLAYLIFEDGVVTVIVFSSIFAATTLHFKSEELILLYMTVQFTALMGSFIFARPIDYWGPKKVISLSLVLWILVSISAFFVEGKNAFMIIASIAGLGLGVVQAGSRAFYARFIPEGQESEYFGVYSLVGKSSAVFGPLVFGFVSSTFGSQRPAVLSVAFFFLAGLVLIQAVKGGGPNVEKQAHRSL